MAIVFQLVEATPYRLRYLATQDGVISSPPVAADGFNTIPNDAGATPDLQTDILTAGGARGEPSGGLPLQVPIRARLDGIGPIVAGALNQAQARAIFNSDDNAIAVLVNQYVPRCQIRHDPRLGVIAWATDANVDGQGDPVIEVRSEVGAAATCYIDLHLEHTGDGR